MTSTAIFVGSDIAKADVVVACRPDATSWTVTNDPEGIAATVLTSAWQSNLKVIRVERAVNWAKRSDAVSYLEIV